jgi:SHS2 domain-containing protein
MKRNKPYRFFDHTADLGIEIYGKDPEALFVNAGHALFDAVLHQVEHMPESVHRYHAIEIQGEDWADLMVNWLKELLYLFNGNQQVLVDIRVESLSEKALKAIAVTEAFFPGRHQVGQEIKAVTYHQIQVGTNGDQWRARVIVDI